MSPEAMKLICQEIATYEKLHMGQRFGDDFPAFGELLVGLTEFGQHEIALIFCMASEYQLLMKAVSGAVDQKGKTVDVFRDLLSGTGFEMILLRLAYWGFRAGCQTSEIERLQDMAAHPDGRK